MTRVEVVNADITTLAVDAFSRARVRASSMPARRTRLLGAHQ